MLKEIAVADLRVGMFVHKICGSWIDHPFWRTRFALREAEDVAKLRSSGVERLVIDLERGVDVLPALVPVDEPLSDATPEPAPPPEPPRVGRDYVQAAALCRRSLAPLRSLHDSVRLGRAVATEACEHLVDEIVDSVEYEPTLLVAVARLKAADEYLYLHALAVSALMVALGRQMGLATPQLREAALAGLLLDIGKARLPSELLTRPARLQGDELALMRRHAEIGHALLSRLDGVPRSVLDAVRHHHERLDGSGYPDRLRAEAIPAFARMAAVCDAYDAVTSRRPYRAPWDPGLAMRHLAQSPREFDAVIVQHFVKAVGIYPTGTLLRLKSERLAVVIGRGGSLLTPRVRVFYSVDERHAIEPFDLDLSDPRCEDAVAGIEPPEAWRFPGLEQLWLRG
ncbi:HD-GYP domain-containing protein (c-di-GMP phosphodiesterase class II) [Rubrivivax gelatinosus]|uniref:HD-GYP domain-containing protein n=2 Tax=Rubrivivax gelatinosus TaxID=28068 RepID=UPI0018C9B427|nr:HD-GYP domain-containing protein [Rubrivivax gelatinosus]MBG6081823.1 HD-GYP domain-containing protein (c-di-GMP phosphodiesterase class II) [Rubrivivax gelatinosus]